MKLLRLTAEDTARRSRDQGPLAPETSPLKIIQSASGPIPQVAVSCERLAVLSDIQFSWQASVNLVDWIPVSPVLEQVASGRDPSMQRVEATFTAGDQMRFFRLGVTKLLPAL